MLSSIVQGTCLIHRDTIGLVTDRLLVREVWEVSGLDIRVSMVSSGCKSLNEPSRLCSWSYKSHVSVTALVNSGSMMLKSGWIPNPHSRPDLLTKSGPRSTILPSVFWGAPNEEGVHINSSSASIPELVSECRVVWSISKTFWMGKLGSSNHNSLSWIWTIFRRSICESVSFPPRQDVKIWCSWSRILRALFGTVQAQRLVVSASVTALAISNILNSWRE